jgi:hypothetical protein
MQDTGKGIEWNLALNARYYKIRVKALNARYYKIRVKALNGIWH